MAIYAYPYTYTGERAVLRKTQQLTALNNGNPLTCTIYQTCGVENPALLLAYNATLLTSCNYMYIPAFGRYYYVTGRSVDSGGQMIFELKSDVLMTAGEALMGADVTITRGCPLDYKPTYIRDIMFPLQQSKQIKTYRLDKQPFNVTTATTSSKIFVLNVAGKEAGS